MFVFIAENVIEDDNIVPILVKVQPVYNVQTNTGTEEDESFFTPLGKYLYFYVLKTFIKESLVCKVFLPNNFK